MDIKGIHKDEAFIALSTINHKYGDFETYAMIS